MAKQSNYNNPELNPLQGKLGKALTAMANGQPLTEKQKRLVKKANLPLNFTVDTPLPMTEIAK